ncbi:MAG: PucR family transcriptional regulator [Actinobacteria bacterium]|nr:MAG: PucR family transcriptional regulator [Actinomycetota bacterium]
MASASRQQEAARGLTLARAVETLGQGIVEVLTAPAGLDVEIHGPRIYDPLDPGALGQGDLVLGVNIAAHGVGPLIAHAAGAGAAAVALKHDGATLGEAAGTAQSAGIALLAVTPAITWDQLHALVSSAVAATGAAPSDGNETPVGDLFALANAVAAVVGGAVTIEDARSNVLAYSNLDQPIDEPRRQTILGRRVPEDWTRRLRDEGVFRDLWASDGVIRFGDPDAGARMRLAVAIRAGTEVLGSIWVMEGDEPASARTEQALREAAPLAALHVLRHRASGDLARRERGGLLRGLLERHRSATEVGTGLGLDVNSPCAVVGFHLGVEDDAELALKRARAVDLITLYCEAFRRRVVCAWIGRNVYALLPSLDPASTERAVTLVADIADRSTQALGLALRAGMGSTVPSLHEACRSREEADRVLRVMTQTSACDRAVAHIDEVRVPAILLALGDLMREHPELRLPALDSLAAHDAQHSKAYVQTLKAYLDALGDVTVAAKAMKLHPNSFRYRLRRLGEVSGLDLSDPGHRLVVGLHLLAQPEASDG